MRQETTSSKATSKNETDFDNPGYNYCYERSEMTQISSSIFCLIVDFPTLTCTLINACRLQWLVNAIAGGSCAQKCLLCVYKRNTVQLVMLLQNHKTDCY